MSKQPSASVRITPAQFAELVGADLRLWAEAVAIAGVKLQ